MAEQKIKISELFYSLQGEGLWQGVPSLFLRVFGCNFTCAGYGMPDGELSEERLAVDPEKYTDYNSLPLVHTGCDSYASWDPRFKKLSPMMTIAQIVDKMQTLLPNRKFGPVHLILTGGEPLLGWQKAYPALLDEIRSRAMDLKYLTFETNGTQKMSDELGAYLRGYVDNKSLEVTFSISSKLPSSGEKFSSAIKPAVVASYLNTSLYHLNGINAYFKWVVSSESDLEYIQQAIRSYKDGNVDIPVYLMPAGGTNVLYDQNKKWVAELAMKNGWRYSQRLQVDLWKNAWAT